MPTANSSGPAPVALVVGASRGLGFALAAGLREAGWTVIGTVRGTGATPLHDLARRHPERAAVETVDIDLPADIEALRRRLANRRLDMLFVNAGTTTHDEHVPSAKSPPTSSSASWSPTCSARCG